jgi:DNA-binding MarR family transcriptional regulator
MGMVELGLSDAKSYSALEIAETSSATCVALRARRMSRIITRIYDDAMRPLGMTASQFTLLTEVAKQDGVTAVEIGGDLDIEKSTLSRNLKRLCALKLIDMDPPAGRRGRGLHLTDKGEAALRSAFPIWRATQIKVETALGDESSGTFDRLLLSAEKLVHAS